MLKNALAIFMSAVLMTSSVCAADIGSNTLNENVSLAADESEEVLFGSNKKALLPGTYDINITMKNAGDLSRDSVAGSCIKSGKLIVNGDNTADIEIELQAVTVGPITDWAEQWKIYKNGLNSETFDAAETLNADGKVCKIKFTLPDNNADGVYVSMYVSAMGTAPNAYLLFDFDSIGTEKTPKIFTGTAHIDQFGEYDVNASVTVTDGIITDVSAEGANFAGTHADYNVFELQSAIDGLKDKFNGKSSKNAEDINSIDAVSGATVSSNAIKQAVLDALSLSMEEEKINVPSEKLEKGLYSVDIAYYSVIAKHSLVENEKIKAALEVDNNGKAFLTTEVRNGTSKEPLYMLDFNGYYAENDTEKPLKTDAYVTKGEVDYNDDVFKEGTKVVTKVSFPLEGEYAATYTTNTKLYVPAMKNLNGIIKGITFTSGVFDADCFVTVYWDSLEKNEEISDGLVYSVPVKMVQAANPAVESMGSSGLDGNAEVYIKDGKASIDISFKAVSFTGLYGHIINLWTYPQTDKMNYAWWDDSEYEIPAKAVKYYSDYGMQYPQGDTTQSEFVKTFRAEREIIGEDHIYIRVSVDAMSGFDQAARLELDWDNAKLISGEHEFDFGNIDCDAAVTASDAAFILQKALVGTFELPIQKESENWMMYADADCDNAITASDAAFVMQKALVGSFELPNEKKYGKK